MTRLGAVRPRRWLDSTPPEPERVLAALPPLAGLGRRSGVLAPELALSLGHTVNATWRTLNALRADARAITVHRRWFKIDGT